MNSEETIIDVEPEESEPRRSPRAVKKHRKFCVYRKVDGEWRELGTFPEYVIGDPAEHRLPGYLKNTFGSGEYKTDVRQSTGRFETSIPITLADADSVTDKVDDTETVEDDLVGEYEFGDRFGRSDNLSAADVHNMILQERLRGYEEAARKSNDRGSSSDVQMLMAELREAKMHEREMYRMWLDQSQQPQANASTMAMTIMKESLDMMKTAKAIGEEMSPAETAGEGESFLGGAARVIDSVGKHAPTFAPLLMGILGGNPLAAAPSNTAPTSSAANGNGPSLADLAGKVKDKGVKP